MPSSAASNQSTSSSSNGGCSGGGSCQFCCELQHHHQHPTSVCQMVSCTPIDALPGYTDHHGGHAGHAGHGGHQQQFVALPPVPRERGRSRMNPRTNNRSSNKPGPPPPRGVVNNAVTAEAVFCSPVILSTSTPEVASSNSSMNGSLGNRWRPRRRRSASNRQRQDASIIRSQQITNNSEMITTTMPLQATSNSASSQGFFTLLS